MANLGTIDVIDANRGTRPVDRTSEVRALAGALDVTKKIVNESILAGVTGDMNRAIDDVVAEEDTSPQSIESSTETAIDNPREAALKATLDKWLLQARQGNASQRTLATIRIKEVLNEAQARFPHLLTELQARAGIVTAGSAKLAELGFSDSRSINLAKIAQKQLDAVMAYATKRIEDGGLGMSPDIQLGSREWLAQYVEFDEIETNQQRNARMISITLSNAEAEATAIEEVVINLFQGKFSVARQDTRRILTDNGFYDTLKELNRGGAANFEKVQRFHSVSVPIILDQLEEQRIEAISFYNEQIKGRMVGTDSGKRAKAVVDDYLNQLDSTITNFKRSVESMPSAMQAIDASTKIMGNVVVRGLSTPHQNLIAFLSGPGKFTVDLANNAKTTDGLILQNELGIAATSLLQEAFPNFLGPGITPSNRQVFSFITTGQGLITKDMTANEVNSSLSKLQRDSDSPWHVSTKTDRDEMEAAYFSIQNHEQMWDAALRVPEKFASPETASDYLTGINNSLIAYNSFKEKPEDIGKVIREGLADERLMAAINVVGDSKELVSRRRAFGASAKEWYFSTRPTKRRDALKTVYLTTRVNGIPLRDLAQIDLNAMSSEGVFSYIVNTKALKLAIKNRLQSGSPLDLVGFDATGSVDSASTTQTEEELRARITELMDPIGKEVTEAITINTNIAQATSLRVADKKNDNLKMQFFDSLGWIEVFTFAEGTLN